MAILDFLSRFFTWETPTPINPGDTSALGIDLSQSKYDFRYLVFPNDLGLSDNGHYVVININAPTSVTNDYAGALGRQFSTPLEPLTRSKVDRLRWPTSSSFRNPLGSVIFDDGGGPGANRPAAAIPRSTRRVQESIALHMPTPLVFNNQNVYEEVSLTALAGKLMVGTSDTLKAFAKGFAEKLTLASALGTTIGAVAGIAKSGVVGGTSKLLQAPINPMVEILFSNTTVRVFVMEFLMSPRNEEESKTIHSIIKTLRFHAAPEIGELVGVTWIPPAEFDITFFNKGVENMNLLRINTCVLERVEVDYAPQGIYSTFRNGHPVAVRLSLAFRELEPVHKKRVLQGF